LPRKSSRNRHISGVFTTEHTSITLHCFTRLTVLTKYYKTRNEKLPYFLPAKQWFNNALPKAMNRHTCFKAIW